jgi:hypothetical protein
LIKVWQMVTDLGIPRDRLVHIGWTKKWTSIAREELNAACGLLRALGDSYADGYRA